MNDTRQANELKQLLVKPEAKLEMGPRDMVLNSEELVELELFGNLKKPISVEKFPGSILLRKYQQGEVICRQGEAGNSAFYIARSKDVESLFGRPLKNTTQFDQAAATAHILGGATRQARPRSWWQRLFSSSREMDDRAKDKPVFIPNDGPSDIDYETRQAPMYEGDVFGEMSCMTYAPRSATVVAARDCYMVEFMRNIFDQMQKDKGYRQQVDKVYRERVLASHLKQLEFFRDLESPQIAELTSGATLHVYDPGDVICDEFDPSDSVYIVRSGVVQVVTGVSAFMSESLVQDWPDFCKSLIPAGQETALKPKAMTTSESSSPASSVDDILAAARGDKPAESEGVTGTDEDHATTFIRSPTEPVSSPEDLVWHWITSSVQSAIRRLSTSDGDDNDRQLVISAINQLIKQRELAASKDLLPVLQRAEVAKHVGSFPKGFKGAGSDWSELEVRVGNFAALRSLFPDHLPSRHGSSGPPRILGYLARGECFGEMGVISDQPRSASCIAYDHPSDDPGRRPGRVEIVRIDAGVFRSLLEGSKQLSRTIGELVRERQAELDTRPAIGEASPWDTSPEFRDSGLIQGQNLLLIDLDSCTHCGDCVRACINTHDDGYSRLFLDGPRFDRFLVPSACRLCLNPSCMIGCPVGSIQRGSDGQIEIRDWCIGCSLCARQCPYDSIQMHDVGLIPEQALGWMYAPLSAVGAEPWQSTSSNGKAWTIGNSPFRWSLDFQSDLARQSPGRWSAGSSKIEEAILFRYDIKIDLAHLSRLGHLRLQIISEGLEATAWINGTGIELTQDAKQKKKGEFSAEFHSSDVFCSGHNRVSIQLNTDGEETTCLKDGSTVLSLRLDPVPEVGVITAATADGVVRPSVELVTERAIVCDVCSGLDGQEPACVSQCPHESAMRVDARSFFTLQK
jgi:CRP-like cAMP-binding protein/Fe-S-cluster-containing hydrogenase component 2